MEVTLMSMSYEKVMAILEDERQKELTCAMKSKELMRRTLNPIRRIQCKASFNMFMGHVNGIYWAIGRIRREAEKES